MTSRTAFVLLLGLAGCASQQSAEPEPPPPAKTKAANVAAPATTHGAPTMIGSIHERIV